MDMIWEDLSTYEELRLMNMIWEDLSTYDD